MLCTFVAKTPVAGPRLQRRPTTTRKLHIVRAEKQETKTRPQDPKPEKPEDDEPKSDGPSLKKDLAKMTDTERKDIEEAMTALKAQGFDSEVAQKVLKAWQEEGITDSSGMKGQFLKMGLSVLLTQGIQTGFDSLAAYCSWNTAAAIGVQQFFGAGFLGAALDTLGWYFAIGVLFDLFSLGAIAASTIKMGGKTEQTYAAVLELAGEKSGLGLVDKVQQAVSATKVALALNSISAALKMDAESQPEKKRETLDRLGSMLLLSDAQKKYDFVATEKYDISNDEADRLTATFSKYDANGDFKLEFSEFKRLCQETDFQLDDQETKAAMKLIDKRGSGFVEFDEFAAWWVESVQVEKPEPAVAEKPPAQ